MTQTQSRKKNLFQMNVDLMHGPIFRSLVLFMLPILISNLFQQLYNTVDTMIVGNVLGDTALAAIGSCGAIYELLVGFGLGIGNGLAIVAAQQRDAAGVPAAQLGAERGAGPVVHCRDGHGRGRCRCGYRDRTGRVSGAVHPLCHDAGAHPHPGPEASGRGPQAVLGPVQPEHLHGPDEQHRVCRFGDLAVRHQRAGHPDHRRTHGGPQAVCLPRITGQASRSASARACGRSTCIRWWSWW